MTPLAVIRPQPGCDATVAAARALGLDAHGFPLFAVRAASWDPPDPAAIDALLIGSANALRHGGDALARYRRKPVHAVGATTAEVARAMGFAVESCGQGGLQAVLDRVAPEHGRLLRLAGKDRVALDPPVGVALIERIVYVSEELPMAPGLVELLPRGPVVLLHSARAASHFAKACDAIDAARRRIALAALAPRIAEAAGLGWAAVASAREPDDEALLALAREMCQTGPHLQG